MKKRLAEETILFLSVAKWVILATVIGALVGLTTSLFIKGLEWSQSATTAQQSYYLALPFVLFLTAWLGYEVLPASDAHATNRVIEIIHRSGSISLASVLKAFFLPIATIAGGGSAGKEAPCADVGAGVGHWMGNLLQLNAEDRRKLMICGVSAGFASVFGVPLAGALFGVEVLFVGGLLYEVILPSLVAGITAYQVSSLLGVTYFTLPLTAAPQFSQLFFAKVILAAVFFGLCSALFIEAMKVMKLAADRIPVRLPLKGFLGGWLLVFLVLFSSPRYLGLGLDSIQSALNGGSANWYDPVLKTIFTGITLAFGGFGGIITPILFVGTTAGAALAGAFGLDIGTFAALGMVCLLSGAANTPISASIMAMELFGPAIAPYATVACVISFLMTGHRSIYPAQILSIRKSSSIQVPQGSRIGKVEAAYHQQYQALIDKIKKSLRRKRS
jgi:H+/Cl- antiporter ClcA